ncbi:MAG: diguanylate cyclase [Spirochaetia bacterium]
MDENNKNEQLSDIENLFHGLPLPVYVWQKQDNDFILSNLNKAAEDGDHGKMTTVRGKKLSDIYESGNPVLKDIHRTFETRETISREIENSSAAKDRLNYLRVTYSFIPPNTVLVYTEDITNIRNSIDKLNKEKTLLRSLVEGISEALIAVDKDGVISAVNNAAEQMFIYKEEEMIGKKIEMLVPEAKREIHEEHRNRYMRNPKTRKMGRGMYLSGIKKYGKEFPVEIGLNTINSESGIAVIALITDITERLRADQMLEKAALTDALTGIGNRRSFKQFLDVEESRTKRGGTPYSIVMCDIDYFKQVNDSYGHAAGDQVLKSVAKLLVNNTRGADTVARWGGEEFIILLPETGNQGAAALAEKLRLLIDAEIIHTDVGVVSVTMSFGTAQKKKPEAPEDVISRADKNLYKAKQNGRNRVSGE